MRVFVGMTVHTLSAELQETNTNATNKGKQPTTTKTSILTQHHHTIDNLRQQTSAGKRYEDTCTLPLASQPGYNRARVRRSCKTTPSRRKRRRHRRHRLPTHKEQATSSPGGPRGWKLQQCPSRVVTKRSQPLSALTKAMPSFRQRLPSPNHTIYRRNRTESQSNGK
jgi:hypothetical protein